MFGEFFAEGCCPAVLMDYIKNDFVHNIYFGDLINNLFFGSVTQQYLSKALYTFPWHSYLGRDYDR